MDYKDKFNGNSDAAAQERLLLRLVVLMCSTDISSISHSQFRLICGIFKSKIMEMDGDCKKVLLSEVEEAIETSFMCRVGVSYRMLNDEVVDDLSRLHSQILADKSELDRLRSAVRRLSPVQCFALLDRIEEALDNHDGDFEAHFERVYKKVEGSEAL